MSFISSHRYRAVVVLILIMVGGSFVWSPTSVLGYLVIDDGAPLPSRPDLDATFVSPAHAPRRSVDPTHIRETSFVGDRLDDALFVATDHVGRPDFDEQLDEQLDELMASASSYGFTEFDLASNGLPRDGFGLFGNDAFQGSACALCDVVYGGPRAQARGGVPIPSGGGGGVAPPPLEFKLDNETHDIQAFLPIPNGPLGRGSSGGENDVYLEPPPFGPPPSETPASVPEPATVTLTGLGIAGLVARSRRARQRRAGGL